MPFVKHAEMHTEMISDCWTPTSAEHVPRFGVFHSFILLLLLFFCVGS